MKSKLAWVGFFVFGACASADTLETVFFRADLTTANEVPAVTGVNASARAIITAHIRRSDAGAIVSGLVDFDVDYNFENDGTFSGLHIHDGAAGANGPVTINTGLGVVDGIAAQGTGNITRQGLATSAAALATLNGMLTDPSKYYVNLHTNQHGGGVVRAQLSRAEMRVFRSAMDPANEVPPVVSDARGSGSLVFLVTRDANGVITAGTVTFETGYNFSTPVTFTGWHIHTGAAGANGPVVINTALGATATDAQNVTSGTVRRRVDVTSGAGLDAMRGIFVNPGAYYLNIHTQTNTGGVMRGQLEETVQNSYQVSMTTAAEVPAVTGLEASGLGKFTVFSTRNASGAVASATAVFDVTYQFPAGTTFNGLHIHSGVAGQNGGVVINTGIGASNSVTDADGVGNIYRVVDVSPLTAAALTATQGLLANPPGYYLNLHTTANASGAVRGQLGPALGRPTISRNGVLNNASYNLAGTSVAPGSIAAVFGSDLTNGASCLWTQGCNPRFTAGAMSNAMAGTTATVNGTPAPILYATPTQLGIQIPADVTGTSAAVVIRAEGQTSVEETVAVEPAAPGIFSATGDGRGAGAITHANGALVTQQNPAVRGEVLVLYATGMGAPPNLSTGFLPTGLVQTTGTTSVTVGGISAPVVFAGMSGCCVGLNQVNFTVPSNAPSGNAVAVTLSVGAKSANPVTIAVAP